MHKSSTLGSTNKAKENQTIMFEDTRMVLRLCFKGGMFLIESQGLHRE